MKWALSLCFIGFVIVGCSGKKPEATATTSTKPAPAAEQDPEKKVYEQLRTGLYQTSAASQSLEDGFKLAKELAAKTSGESKEALLDVADHLDGAGASISDFIEEPPTFEDFHKQFADFDDRRLKCIAASSDALTEARLARGTLEDLSANAPKEFKDSLETLTASNDEAIQALSEAITGMGGKLPPEEILTPDDTLAPDTSASKSTR